MIFIKTLKSTIQIKKRNIDHICDIIPDMLSNKTLNSLVTEIFISGRKLNISLVFITQSYFAVPKNIKTKLNALSYYENSKQARTSTNHI